MPTIEEQTARSTAQAAKEVAEALAEFFEKLLKALEENEKFKAQASLIKWMKSGGAVREYKPQGYTVEKLLFEMEKEKIPYFALGENSILIRDPDYDKVLELNEQILLAEKNYYQQVPTEKLETAINARSGGQGQVLTISNLTPDELETLKRKCNNICKGFTVGTKVNGDNSELTINTGHIYSQNPEKNDFCKSYIQYLFAYYGFDHDQRAGEFDADRKFEGKVKELIDKQEEFYICGMNDHSKCIQVDANGMFTYEYKQQGSELLKVQKKFWELCNGGKIQYVRYPVNYNTEAVRTLIRRAMAMGLYEGVTLSLAFCEDCGHEELEMDVCPVCGSRNLTKIDRMNGYLSYSRVHGDTRLNDAKMAEIADRKSM